MDKQREIELARSIHGDDKSDEEILELIDRANGISEGDRSKILMNALETEEGRKGLKHVAEHAMPREYADVFSKMIDGDEDDMSEDEIMAAIHNNVLDSVNKGRRSKEDAEILMRGKLSFDQIHGFKKNEG